MTLPELLVDLLIFSKEYEQVTGSRCLRDWVEERYYAGESIEQKIERLFLDGNSVNHIVYRLDYEVSIDRVNNTLRSRLLELKILAGFDRRSSAQRSDAFY